MLKIIILPFVLHGHETLTEEYLLVMCDSGALRRIFVSKRDEKWAKLHNDNLHGLYSGSNIIRMSKSRGIKCTEHVARMVEKRNAYRALADNPEDKRPL
jgi:hypothetical protein